MNGVTMHICEALAAIIRQRMETSALEAVRLLPVVGEMAAVRADGDCVLVQSSDVEDLIPQQFFYRVSGSIKTRVACKGRRDDDRQDIMQEMSAILAGLARESWRYRELDKFGIGATVAGFILTPFPPELNGNFWEAGVEWRIYFNL